MKTHKNAPVEPGGIVRDLCDTTDNRRVTADIYTVACGNSGRPEVTHRHA